MICWKTIKNLNWSEPRLNPKYSKFFLYHDIIKLHLTGFKLLFSDYKATAQSTQPASSLKHLSIFAKVYCPRKNYMTVSNSNLFMRFITSRKTATFCLSWILYHAFYHCKSKVKCDVLDLRKAKLVWSWVPMFCCVFRSAFGFCSHPKAGWNTFFRPFSTFF